MGVGGQPLTSFGAVPDRNISLIEGNAHPVVSLPDDVTRQFKPVIRHNQIERVCDRNDLSRVGKLDRRAGGRKVAHRARVYVTAVLSDGSLINFVTWG